MPELTTALRYLKGIGPARADALAEAGVRTIEDLLFHLPFRYEDRSRFLPIAALLPGVRGTVRGRVTAASLRRTRRRGLTLFEALVQDDSGAIPVVFFNQPYLKTLLQPGREVVLHGEAQRPRTGRRRLVLTAPQYEVLARDGDEAIHTGRVVPIYPRLPGLSSRSIRRLTHAILRDLPEDLGDPLPAEMTRTRGFPSRRHALEQVHFPPPGTDPARLAAFGTAAHRRLIFEEFFFLQLGFALARRRLETDPT
ncbi:MAG: OB-fold nucleic acid binding domain-containing protein, partial [Candidatus Polarisedimenticolia bacterium]